MSLHRDFPVSTYPGEKRRARAITCGACPEVGYLRDNSIASLPDDVIAKKFRQMGWLVGSRPKAHRCPACIAKPGPRGLPQESPMPEPAPAPAIAAVPPPTLTPPVRRRILEHLETVYDTKAGRYSGAINDAVSAKALSVPRAWVAEVREALFGPEANEAAEIRDRAVADLEARCVEIETNMLTVLDTTESAIKAIRAELAKLRA